MNNVTNFELSKQLYKLTKWTDEFVYAKNKNGIDDVFWSPYGLSGRFKDAVPAYTFGFLMRKLPATFSTENYKDLALSITNDGETWSVGYADYDDGMYTKDDLEGYADSPEDAAAMLLIHLIYYKDYYKGQLNDRNN